MLAAAAAMAVTVPRAASHCFPANTARKCRTCWSCRAARVEAGHSRLEVRKVTYRPPGTEQNLLNEINLSLQEKRQAYLPWLHYIFGCFYIPKSVFVQFWFDIWTEWEWKDNPFAEPTSGSICIQKYDDTGNPIGLPELLTSQRVGIVFQFPERYFLADTVLEEVTFGWPRQKADLLLKEQLALNLQNAFNSVGLTTISLDENPQALSGGFKRRLALAIQLVQTPDLLLLDEPLAGLDWKARADVVNLLKDLKKHHTILVVSHDLRELYPLVDRSWRMEMGGSLKEEALPV
ncbi:ABC transporter I family member 11 chloroplastic [Zea mays]|uniref:ABC transporter I family member 11 chloroplastic n=1 Tax=Zea mays TaxID=4577 RepID=A0A1D6F5K0_MAIZE|nr:ABC transporter I family member 11 chloroplastic [Zea mays]